MLDLPTSPPLNAAHIVTKVLPDLLTSSYIVEKSMLLRQRHLL